MQRARGTRGEDAGTRAPPSPGVPPKRAKVGASEGAPAVASGAPVFLRSLRDTAVLAGSDLQLRVAVSGTPQPSLSWFQDGQLLPPPVPEPSCLWLRSCGPRAAGVYRCMAQNAKGEASCQAVVTVLEVRDSETGEDDISDVQGTQRLELRDDGAFSTPTGGSDTLVGTSLDTPPTSVTGTSEEQVSWWGSGQTVLEQEAGSGGGTRRLQGSPRQAQAAGAGPRHLGVEPLVRASRANLVGASWGSEDSLSVASDLYGSAFSLYRGRALSIQVSVPPSGSRREEPDPEPQPASEALRRPTLPPPSKSALLPPPSPRVGKRPPPGQSAQAAARPTSPHRRPQEPVLPEDATAEEKRGRKARSSGPSLVGTPRSRGPRTEQGEGPQQEVRRREQFPLTRGRAIQECRSPVPPAAAEPAEPRTKTPSGRKREPPAQAVRFLPWATPGQESATGVQTLEKNRAGPEAEKRLRRGPEEDGPWGAWDRRGARSHGKGRRPRPTSPELESSDDSYVSAGEEPLEAPLFEIPLQNVAVAPGEDALLKCIITANPPPQVSWQKDGSALGSNGRLLIRAEGERHTLLLREAREADAGSYAAIATNELGTARCAAALAVRPGREPVTLGRSGEWMPAEPPDRAQGLTQLQTCRGALALGLQSQCC
ncbi:striated muscle preferentially expressed protein kinase-like [Echinops telfairi]|uniref:Striated muscle preferentially expressed protein kinase-like n=1 Tax=Echinops telfairi TaxID=9371 RepID=A0AC55DEG9_ECHTE|nr:striated muscle preferentially expressed protein kinase-like [Echinops telfairi]